MRHQQDGTFGVGPRQPDKDILHRPARDKSGMNDSHSKSILHLRFQAKEADLTQRAQLAAEAEVLILKDAVAIPIMDRFAATAFQPWVLGYEDINPIYPHHRYNEVWLAPEHR